LIQTALQFCCLQMKYFFTTMNLYGKNRTQQSKKIKGKKETDG